MDTPSSTAAEAASSSDSSPSALPTTSSHGIHEEVSQSIPTFTPSLSAPAEPSIANSLSSTASSPSPSPLSSIPLPASLASVMLARQKNEAIAHSRAVFSKKSIGKGEEIGRENHFVVALLPPASVFRTASNTNSSTTSSSSTSSSFYHCHYCWESLMIATPSVPAASTQSSITSSKSKTHSTSSSSASELTERSLLNTCEKCHQAFYCNRICQRNDWTRHRIECYVLAHYKSKPKNLQPIYFPTLMVILRILLIHFLKSPNEEQRHQLAFFDGLTSQIDKFSSQRLKQFTEQAINVLELLQHLVRLQADVLELRDREQTKESKALKKALSVYDFQRVFEMRTENLLPYFCRVALNAHTITDGETRPVGLGLFLHFALLNHSCEPNALLLFLGGLATLRAVKPISAGEEICIAYVDVAQITKQRRKLLSESYFFECQCRKCEWSRNTEVGKKFERAISAFKCQNEWKQEKLKHLQQQQFKQTNGNNSGSVPSTIDFSGIAKPCGGFLLMDDHADAKDSDSGLASSEEQSDAAEWKCDECGKSQLVAPLRSVQRQVSSMFSEAGQARAEGKSNKAKRVYRDLLLLLAKYFDVSHVHILDALVGLGMLCVDDEAWSDALRCYEQSAGIVLQLYPPFHPTVGIHLYLCAKLNWLLVHTRKALARYVQARDILLVTHGAQHPMVKMIELAIREAKYEYETKGEAGEKLKQDAESEPLQLE